MNDASWTDPLIPKHGGYRNLRSFQIAQLVYDVTVRFCERYMSRRSRTYDQMVQAARSGVQNIAEGSQTSGTSRKSEMRLTSVARASLEELRLDYEDFLRHRKLELWRTGDQRRQSLINARATTADDVARWVAHVGRHGFAGGAGGACSGGRGGRGGLWAISAAPSSSSDRTDSSAQHDSSTNSGESTASTTSTRTPAAPTETRATSTGSAVKPTTTPDYRELSANAALTLIAVACSLLDRQLAALARAFTEEGGFSERLYRVQSARRRDPGSRL